MLVPSSVLEKLMGDVKSLLADKTKHEAEIAKLKELRSRRPTTENCPQKLKQISLMDVSRNIIRQREASLIKEPTQPLKSSGLPSPRKRMPTSNGNAERDETELQELKSKTAEVVLILFELFCNHVNSWRLC